MEEEKTENIREEVIEEVQDTGTRENEDWHTKYLYLAADFENYRKNMSQRMSDIIASGNEKIVLDLLEVVDDFDRAMDNNEVKEGTRLIIGKLHNVLRNFGVDEIQVNKGDDFNVDCQDALAVTGEDNKVTDIIQKGYRMNGRIIRHAKVVL